MDRMPFRPLWSAMLFPMHKTISSSDVARERRSKVKPNDYEAPNDYEVSALRLLNVDLEYNMLKMFTVQNNTLCTAGHCRILCTVNHKKHVPPAASCKRNSHVSRRNELWSVQFATSTAPALSANASLQTIPNLQPSNTTTQKG